MSRFFILFFIGIFYLYNALPVMSSTITSKRPVYRRYNPPISYNNGYSHRYPRTKTTAFSDLNALEKYVLNKNYPRESDLSRLQRLEIQTFGAVQRGDLNTRYNNVRNSILSRPKQNYKTSFFRNLGNYFSGQMTGYTPSLENDPFFADSYFPQTSAGSYGSSSSIDNVRPFRRGSYLNNYGTNTSTGVHILD